MSGTTIENDNATPYWDNQVNVCQLSGFKAKSGGLVQRWDGLWVLPRFNEPRSSQDFIRSVPEGQRGSIRPEQSDTFIDPLNPVQASDL